MTKISRKDFEKYDDLGKSKHPDQVMGEMVLTAQRIGTNQLLHGSKFKQKRESFVAALFTYAIRKWSKREWFIQQIQDPPDFYIMSPTNRSLKEKPIDRIGVEIVEIRDTNLAKIIQTLERTKLINYRPEPNTTLLLFINVSIPVKTLKDLNIWISGNQRKFNSFSEVYILVLNKFSDTDALKYAVVNTFKAWQQDCILKDEFGKGIIYPHPLLDKFKVEFTD